MTQPDDIMFKAEHNSNAILLFVFVIQEQLLQCSKKLRSE